jgi:hypothetical protein
MHQALITTLKRKQAMKTQSNLSLLKSLIIRDLNVVFGVMIVGAMAGALLNTIFVVSGL